jgi:hypothetical protein
VGAHYGVPHSWSCCSSALAVAQVVEYLPRLIRLGSAGILKSLFNTLRAGSELATEQLNLHALWCRYGLIDCSTAKHFASEELADQMPAPAHARHVDARSKSARADLPAQVAQHAAAVSPAYSAAAASNKPTSQIYVRQLSAVDSLFDTEIHDLATIVRKEAVTLSSAPSIQTVHADSHGAGSKSGTDIGLDSSSNTRAEQDHGAMCGATARFAAGAHAAMRPVIKTFLTVSRMSVPTIPASSWPLVLLMAAGLAILAAAFVFKHRSAKSQEMRRLSDLEAAAMKAVFCGGIQQGSQPAVSNPPGMPDAGTAAEQGIHRVEQEDCAVVVSEASTSGAELLCDSYGNSQQHASCGVEKSAFQWSAMVDASVRYRDRTKVEWAPAGNAFSPCTSFSNPLFGDTGHTQSLPDSGPGSPSIPANRTKMVLELLAASPDMNLSQLQSSGSRLPSIVNSTATEHVQRKLTAAKTVLPNDLIAICSQGGPELAEWSAADVQSQEQQADKRLTKIQRRASLNGMLLKAHSAKGSSSIQQLLQRQAPSIPDTILRSIKMPGFRLLTSEEFKV